MTMIERVARAIYDRGNPTDIDFGDQHQVLKDGWFRIAKAAIEAMREPTDKMLVQGMLADVAIPDNTKAVYYAMIEAALKE